MSYPFPEQPKVEIVRLSVAPGVLAVSMEEMRLALRADSEDEDLTIQRMIEGAQDYFEIRCAWRLTPAVYYANVIGGFCNPIVVPRGPLRSVTAVEWWSCDADEWIGISGDNWRTEDANNEFRVYIERDAMFPVSGPLPFGAPGLRISFEAGFDGAENAETSAVGEADSGMIQCLKTLVSYMFNHREQPVDSEMDMIVRRYRKFW